MIPNLLGTRHWFHGRQIFPWTRGRWVTVSGWFKHITFIVHFISIIIISAPPQSIRSQRFGPPVIKDLEHGRYQLVFAELYSHLVQVTQGFHPTKPSQYNLWHIFNSAQPLNWWRLSGPSFIFSIHFLGLAGEAPLYFLEFFLTTNLLPLLFYSCLSFL